MLITIHDCLFGSLQHEQPHPTIKRIALKDALNVESKRGGTAKDLDEAVIVLRYSPRIAPATSAVVFSIHLAIFAANVPSEMPLFLKR